MKTAPARHSCLSFMLMLTEFIYLFIFMKPTVSLFFIFIFRRDHHPRRLRRRPPGRRRKRYTSASASHRGGQETRNNIFTVFISVVVPRLISPPSHRLVVRVHLYGVGE